MSEETKDASAEVASGPSLLQRFRIPLLAGGVTLGLIVFFLLGIMLGSLKSSADRKQFAARLESLKQNSEQADSERKILEAKVEGLKQVSEEKKALVDELRTRLDCYEAAASQAMEAEKADAEKQSLLKPTVKTGGGGKIEGEAANKGYMHYGNSSCTLVVGQGNNGWKDCVTQGRFPAGLPSKEASHVDEKKAEEKKPESAAKPAH